MDLRDRLDRHFRDQSSVTPSPDLGAVMERGEQLRTRHRVLSVAVPAVVLLLIGAGMAAFLRRSAPRTDIADVVADRGVLELVASDIEWTASPATLGHGVDHVTDGNLLYVLSTAPGTRRQDFPDGNLPQAIYTSVDGTEWQSHPLGDRSVGDLAVDDGLLYTLGTAPGARADTVTLEVGVSDDGGATLDTTALTTERQHSMLVSPRLAVTADGVLAIATSIRLRQAEDPTEVSPEVLEQLPPDLLEDGNVAVQTQVGVAVVPPQTANDVEFSCASTDPVECQTLIEDQALFFASWDDLAVPDPVAEVEDPETTVALWSTDGVAFQEIDPPFGDGRVEGIYRLGGDVVVTTRTGAGIQLYRHAGGGDWQQARRPPDLQGTLDAGLVGDTVVMVGWSEEMQGLAIYRAGSVEGPWEPVRLDRLLPLGEGPESFLGIVDAAVGDHGVAISLVQEGVGESGNPFTELLGKLFPDWGERSADPGTTVSAVLHSQDLQTWSISAENVPDGGVIDSLLYTPGGDLLGHASAIEGGQPLRRQLLASP